MRRPLRYATTLRSLGINRSESDRDQIMNRIVHARDMYVCMYVCALLLFNVSKIHFVSSAVELRRLAYTHLRDSNIKSPMKSDNVYLRLQPRLDFPSVSSHL